MQNSIKYNESMLRLILLLLIKISHFCAVIITDN